MTSLTRQRQPSAAPRHGAAACWSVRRARRRWPSSDGRPLSTTASAASRPLVEAPLLQSGFAGLRVGAQGERCHVAAARPDRRRDQRAAAAPTASSVRRPGRRSSISNRRVGSRRPVRSTRQRRMRSRRPGPVADRHRAVDRRRPDTSGCAREHEDLLSRRSSKRLAAKGVFVAGGADGVYGPATTTAVKQFQSWNGFTQTGGITIRTAAALGLGSSSTPPASDADHSPLDQQQPVCGSRAGRQGRHGQGAPDRAPEHRSRRAWRRRRGVRTSNGHGVEGLPGRQRHRPDRGGHRTRGADLEARLGRGLLRRHRPPRPARTSV